MADSRSAAGYFAAFFSLPAGDAALWVRDQRTIDFHPVARRELRLQLYRTTVDTQLVFRQIDVITQRQ